MTSVGVTNYLFYFFVIFFLTDWYPDSEQAAKVVLQYNLSVTYVYRGEYEKAGELLRTVLPIITII